MPLQNLDTLFDLLLQDLPPEFHLDAFTFKAFTRSRKIKSVAELLRLVLLYCGADLSLREVAGNMTLLGCQLTDQAVLQRLKKCQPWLQVLLSKLLRLNVPLPSSTRLLVADATNVVGPGAKGSQWRLHLVVDLLTAEFISIKITDYRTGESLRLIELKQGDCLVADSAFCRRDAIFESVELGADLFVRLNHRLVPVIDESGNKVDLLESLKRQACASLQTLEVAIESSKGNRLKVWLHAYRMREKQAVEARRKCRRRNRKLKGGIKEKTLFLAEFVIVLTTVSPQQINAEQALEIYRCRWQIEVLIKRLKSLLDADNLRARAMSLLAEVWLSGKMIYVLLIERRSRRMCNRNMYVLDDKREATCWRVWKMQRRAVNRLITADAYGDEQRWEECLKAISERRRNRKLQRLPQTVIRYLSEKAGCLNYLQ